MSETERIDTLKALQKQIREATGPDRVLDVRIQRAFDGEPLPTDDDEELAKYVAASDSFNIGRKFSERDGLWSLDQKIFPPFTTYPYGLGACVALMLEVCPGVKWVRTVDGRFALRGFRNTPQWSYYADPLANDCLTFIDAICSALIAEIEAKERVE